MKKNIISEDLLLLSFLIFLSSNIILTSFFLILKIYYFEIIFIISLLNAFLILFYFNKSSIFKNSFLFLLIFIFAYLLCKYIFTIDVTSDSNTAHIPMVFYLMVKGLMHKETLNIRYMKTLKVLYPLN